MKKCPHCGESHRDEMLFCPKTGKAISVSRIARGTLIDEKYEVVRRVASGGMGAVYEAIHKRMGRRVAIKLILPELASNKEVSQRFEIEARAASAIGHENIVEVFDLGTTKDGLPFLVMEFLDGKDLGTLIEEQGPLPLPVAKHIIGQVLDALAAAHDQKIIHRDLKPENVFLVSRGDDPHFVKLLDFGISKMCGGEEAKLHLTSTGLILGTPFYMSPEQARGEKTIDHRSDLFSAGTMLYQSLTGKRPFTAENLNQLLYQIIGGRIVPPREANPEIPEELERVLLKALSTDTETRFSNAKEFKATLLGERQVSASEIVVPPIREGKSTEAIAYSPTLGGNTPGPLSSSGASTPMSWTGGGTAEASPPSRRWLLGLGGVGLVLVAGVATFLALQGGGKKDPPQKDPPPAQRAGPRAGSQATKDGAMESRPSAKKQQTTVKVTLHLEPEDAQVYLDGELVKNLPLKLKRSQKKHALEVRKEGYVPKTLPVTAQADHVLVVSLTRKEKKSEPSRRRSSRRRRASRRKHTRKPPSRQPRTRPRDRGSGEKRDIKAITDI